MWWYGLPRQFTNSIRNTINGPPETSLRRWAGFAGSRITPMAKQSRVIGNHFAGYGAVDDWHRANRKLGQGGQVDGTRKPPTLLWPWAATMQSRHLRRWNLLGSGDATDNAN